MGLWEYAAERCQGEMAGRGMPRPRWAQLWAVAPTPAELLTLTRAAALVGQTAGGPEVARALARRRGVVALLAAMAELAELARGCWVAEVVRPEDARAVRGEVSTEAELERARKRHLVDVGRRLGPGAFEGSEEGGGEAARVGRLVGLLEERGREGRPVGIAEIALWLGLGGANEDSRRRRVHEVVLAARVAGHDVRSGRGARSPGKRGYAASVFYLEGAGVVAGTGAIAS